MTLRRPHPRSMQTRRLSADPQALRAPQGEAEILSQQAILVAAEILQSGGTVAFATETVYGLGANALDAEAVGRIFAAKQRPVWDPLIVHVADERMLARVSLRIPQAARLLMDRFWPGPLTLLVPRHPDLPDAVTAGRASVGVRMPAHPVAMALLRAAGVPVAAPSANTFGHVSPTTAAHVAADLDGRIDAILDSGETMHGLESTVVDTCVEPCILYRPGALSLDQLRAVWPSIVAYVEKSGSSSLRDTGEPAALPSPGLGIRHYAPRARLVLVEGADLEAEIGKALGQALARAERVGLMLPEGIGPMPLVDSAVVYRWGNWSDPALLAHRLFSGLRALDAQGAEVIICPLPEAKGIGIAMVDRLRKAARRT